MCGRFALYCDVETLESLFDIDFSSFRPSARYNIAPTQIVAAVRQCEDGRRELFGARWGLVPAWVKDRTKIRAPINARIEGIRQRPMFRSALKTRCLLPASGFFEWKARRGKKIPYFIHRSGASRAETVPLAFAALWDRWADAATGEIVESCVILTTRANAQISELHDRMPVMIPEDDFDLWLQATDRTGLDEILAEIAAPEYSGISLAIDEVSPRLNDARHDEPELLDSASAHADPPRS